MTPQAGLLLALVGAAELPMERPTASEPGPGFGVLVGWEVARERFTIAAEAQPHVNLPAPVVDVPLGTAMAWGRELGVGPYVHLSVPVAYSYPIPGGDLGAQLLYRPDHRFRASLRLGYDLVFTTRYKCACPQPSQSWAVIQLVVGATLGRRHAP